MSANMIQEIPLIETETMTRQGKKFCHCLGCKQWTLKENYTNVITLHNVPEIYKKYVKGFRGKYNAKQYVQYYDVRVIICDSCYARYLSKQQKIAAQKKEMYLKGNNVQKPQKIVAGKMIEIHKTVVREEEIQLILVKKESK